MSYCKKIPAVTVWRELNVPTAHLHMTSVDITSQDQLVSLAYDTNLCLWQLWMILFGSHLQQACILHYFVAICLSVVKSFFFVLFLIRFPQKLNLDAEMTFWQMKTTGKHTYWHSCLKGVRYMYIIHIKIINISYFCPLINIY